MPLLRCLWVTIWTKVMLFPKCDFFGTPCIKVQNYQGFTCFLLLIQSAETVRLLPFGSTHFLGSPRLLGFGSTIGSSSHPSSSEGIGVTSGELISRTNLGLDKYSIYGEHAQFTFCLASTGLVLGNWDGGDFGTADFNP